MPDRGMYTTARIELDATLVANRDRTARGKVERYFGCWCRIYDDTGKPIAWAEHPTDATCPADPTLDEVLQILGFTETRRLPRTTVTRPRVRNATGTGRWPTEKAT